MNLYNLFFLKFNSFNDSYIVFCCKIEKSTFVMLFPANESTSKLFKISLLLFNNFNKVLKSMLTKLHFSKYNCFNFVGSFSII